MGYHVESTPIPYRWYVNAEGVSDIPKLGDHDKNGITESQLDKDIEKICHEIVEANAKNRMLEIEVIGCNRVFSHPIIKLVRRMGELGLYSVIFKNCSYTAKFSPNALANMRNNPRFLEYSIGKFLAYNPTVDELSAATLVAYIAKYRRLEPLGITRDAAVPCVVGGKLRYVVPVLDRGIPQRLAENEKVKLHCYGTGSFVLVDEKTTLENMTKTMRLPREVESNVKAIYNGLSYKAVGNKKLGNGSLDDRWLYFEPVKHSAQFQNSCIDANDLARYLSTHGKTSYRQACYSRMLYYNEVHILNQALFLPDVEFCTIINNQTFRLYKSYNNYRDVSIDELYDSRSLIYIPQILAIDTERLNEVSGEVVLEIPKEEAPKESIASIEKKAFRIRRTPSEKLNIKVTSTICGRQILS